MKKGMLFYFLKKKFIYFFIALEVCLFATDYLLGKQGYRFIQHLLEETHLLEKTLLNKKALCDELQGSIEEWKKEPFLKEAYGRERLHMARPSEEIYMRA